MNPAEIIQLALLFVQISSQLNAGFQTVRKLLADARAAGGISDAQWADLDKQLTDSEAARRAAVASLTA